MDSQQSLENKFKCQTAANLCKDWIPVQGWNLLQDKMLELCCAPHALNQLKKNDRVMEEEKSLQ